MSVEDIFKPLSTRIKIHKANVREIFKKYDTDNSGYLKPEELQRGLQALDINLTHDEVSHLREYFAAKFG